MTSETKIARSTLLLRSPNKTERGHCLINALVQKGWSLDTPMAITYLRGAKPPDSPQQVLSTILPVSWPHPLNSAEKLPSYQLLNMQSEYIQTGRYDRNMLYDTAQLISFPDNKLVDGRIRLFDNNEDTIRMRVTIPQDFPIDLINKPVFLEVSAKVESLSIEASMTLCIIVIG